MDFVLLFLIDADIGFRNCILRWNLEMRTGQGHILAHDNSVPFLTMTTKTLFHNSSLASQTFHLFRSSTLYQAHFSMARQYDRSCGKHLSFSFVFFQTLSVFTPISWLVPTAILAWHSSDVPKESPKPGPSTIDSTHRPIDSHQTRRCKIQIA